MPRVSCGQADPRHAWVAPLGQIHVTTQASQPAWRMESAAQWNEVATLSRTSFMNPSGRRRVLVGERAAVLQTG